MAFSTLTSSLGKTCANPLISNQIRPHMVYMFMRFGMNQTRKISYNTLIQAAAMSRSSYFLCHFSLITSVSTVYRHHSSWSRCKLQRSLHTEGKIEKLQNKIAHSYHWVKSGFSSFGVNARLSLLLMKKKLKGHPLSYREHKLLVQTLGDVFKLIPFSFFIIIPFAEIFIPPALWLFPNLLPSTFKTPKADASYLQNRLVAIQELTQFFQELVAVRTKEISEKNCTASQKERTQILRAFHESLLRKGVLEQQQIKESSSSETLQTNQGISPFLSLEETLKFAKLFRDNFKLENLPTEILTVMCRMLGLEPYKMRLSILLQLRHHILKLQKEDREILWEGVESLSHHELVEACKDRAMRFYGVSDEIMRDQLSTWLRLSSHRDISPVLLLWSRSITLTHSNEFRDADRVTTDKFLPEVEKSTSSSEDASARDDSNQSSQENEEYDGKIRRLKAAAEILKISEKRQFDAQKILNALFSSDTSTHAVHPVSEHKTNLVKALQTARTENQLWRQIIAKQHVLNSEIAGNLNTLIFRYQQHIPSDQNLTHGQFVLSQCSEFVAHLSVPLLSLLTVAVQDLETLLKLCDSEAKNVSDVLEELKTVPS